MKATTARFSVKAPRLSQVICSYNSKSSKGTWIPPLTAANQSPALRIPEPIRLDKSCQRVDAASGRGQQQASVRQLVRHIYKDMRIAGGWIQVGMGYQMLGGLPHRYSNKEDRAASRCRMVVPLNPCISNHPARQQCERGKFSETHPAARCR